MKITDVTLDVSKLTYKEKSELISILNSNTLKKDWHERLLEMKNLIYLDYEEVDLLNNGNYFKLSDRLRNKKLVSYAEFKTIVKGE